MMLFKKVDFHKQKERKDLRYGDYIQIRSFGNSQQLSNHSNNQAGSGGNGDVKRIGKVGEGWLVCETNYSGFKPQVKYRRVKNNEFRNLLAYDSIFEIVPPKISMWGQKIDFNGKDYATVSFRHFLTGNLLTYKKISEIQDSGYTHDYTKEELTGKTVQLSESFIDFSRNWIEDKENKKLMEKIIGKKDEFAGPNGQSFSQYLSELYIKTYSICIVKESSSGEDMGLMSSNIIQIMDHENNILEINPEEKIYMNRDIKCAYYNNHYYSLCISEMSTLDVNFLNEDSGDTFYMKHVDVNIISDIIYYVSALEPLTGILNSKTFTIDQIAEGELAIKKLGNFIKMKGRNSGNTFTGSADDYSKQIQNAFKELSIIDVCIKFVYLYIGYEIPNHEEDYELFLNSVIKLLHLTCQYNQLNCYYIFQWHKLFTGMILGEINLDSGRPCRVDVDKLMTTIFSTTGINISVVNNIIDPLLKNYSFERYDSKRLNLLYSLFKIPEG